MEFTLDEYKRSNGKTYSSSDGFKYFSCKIVEKQTYLRCTLFRRSCKGTAKLDQDTNLIHPKLLRLLLTMTTPMNMTSHTIKEIPKLS